ncbi:hypothetical protein DFH07DRAFT_872228 [Mycena maculata]|uniref:NAD(P)-binding domain-containing protein n=1 Tax=Mycena maculata TaxID=230809 RepID=A0AAD7HHG5_9AGAR|nr:hypothetical protein DFH07DRAFT_872228 [Mycena maculata]
MLPLFSGSALNLPGYIGLPAAQALVRAGHIVHGLARTLAKAKLLAADENTWIRLIPTLDAVISAISADPNVLLATIEKVDKAAQETRPAGAPLPSYIWTSGTWIQGDGMHEIRIVRRTAVNGIVVRPALIYGRNFAILFKCTSEGRVVWPGTLAGRYTLVHIDDVADLRSWSGKIFDAASPTTESVDELLQKLVRVIASTALVRPYLANALLGWTVKKQGLTDGLETYYAAWLASLSA